MLKYVAVPFKGFLLILLFSNTCDRSLLVVQLRTAFVHFAAFKIIFPRFPQILKNLGKPEPQIPGNLAKVERLRFSQIRGILAQLFPKFLRIWENLGCSGFPKNPGIWEGRV